MKRWIPQLSPSELPDAETAPRHLHSVHARPQVLIAGGGVAGLEALLALRALLGSTTKIELLAPELEFSYGPIAVAEPFGYGEVRRVELARAATEHSAGYRTGALARVDPGRQVAHTETGEALGYDYLVIAIGARPQAPFEGAVVFGGSADVAAVRTILGDAESGRVRRIAFVAPGSIAWLLPLYELALFTAAWARARGIALELTIVTEESRPLEAFGAAASLAVTGLVSEAGISLLTGRTARRYDGVRLTGVGMGLLRADAVISLPQLRGPAIPGLPSDERGFIPTDEHSAVPGLRRVYAAGDGTAFPIKQGGIAAQQADAAAEAIAAELGALEHAQPFRPVLRGILLTGAEPRYLRASHDAEGEHSEIAFQPLWWPPAKIAGRYLAPYLDAPSDPGLTRAELVDRPAPEQDEDPDAAVAEERDAVELLLALADANARRGSHQFALTCLDAAERIAGPLPAERQADRHAWAQRRPR